jgi:tripartite ATP-independent transporter DctP family solute receptor
MMIRKTIALSVLAASALVSTSVLATTFKVAVGDPQGSAQWELATFFKKSFEEKRAGKDKIDLFPNGQLGSEEDTVSNAAMGALDFSILAINNLTPFSPTVGVLTLPYVIQSAEEAKILTTGPLSKELVTNTVRDAKVRIVGWTYTGFRVLTNSKKPVTTLEDLKGLKIRVPKNEIMIATYQAWGINPVPMAWSETFTALQQGVVDGQDNPFATIYSMKFFEVQKYITTIRYVFSLEPMIISESVFQKQPADVQKAILEAGAAATEHSFTWLKASEDKIKQELMAKGMQISAPADDEKEWISKATTQVWPKFYQSIGGKDKLDQALKAVGR